MHVKMMYNITTFMLKCIPVSYGQFQQCKIAVNFHANLIAWTDFPKV